MHPNQPKCSKSVDGQKSCMYCFGRCVKNGQAYGKQRYLCRLCKRSFVAIYTYRAYNVSVSEQIRMHVKESCGIRSIGRLLCISAKTVLSRILKIAEPIRRPLLSFGQTYELDELCTYVQQKTKQCWIVYALSRDTKVVVYFSIGSRSNAVLKRVADSLLLSDARRTYTDKLLQYKAIIPGARQFS